MDQEHPPPPSPPKPQRAGFLNQPELTVADVVSKPYLDYSALRFGRGPGSASAVPAEPARLCLLHRSSMSISFIDKSLLDLKFFLLQPFLTLLFFFFALQFINSRLSSSFLNLIFFLLKNY